ncbi:methylenetetrahydrofolate reductase [Brucella anthropi]|uniref:Methylenetetrahydrofolate reductase n=1 Tax=Brucella anthropi TaxID=529 RepID=A0A6I0DFZ8_BRUAN|nr:methylenetetrahydrofolate reductase [Brucella anthropi]
MSRRSGGGDTLTSANPVFSDMLASASLEVMPKTLERIDDPRKLLPPGGRVYIACLKGTSIDSMIAAARRLTDAGLCPMPHVPARMIPDAITFETWMKRYRNEAGVNQALLLAGGMAQSAGPYHASTQLLETGVFDRLGFERLHVAGHPEGSLDIDPDGTDSRIMTALAWKQEFSNRTNAHMAIVTQFVFDAAPVIAWTRAIRARGVAMPVHIGLAGPTRLATLIKYAVSCGVGPSMSVLQRRAKNLRNLARPFEPTQIASELAQAVGERPELGIEAFHFFPLGGIEATVDWLKAARSDRL